MNEIPRSYVSFKRRIQSEIKEAKVERNFRTWWVITEHDGSSIHTRYNFTDMSSFIKLVKEDMANA